MTTTAPVIRDETREALVRETATPAARLGSSDTADVIVMQKAAAFVRYLRANVAANDIVRSVYIRRDGPDWKLVVLLNRLDLAGERAIADCERRMDARTIEVLTVPHQLSARYTAGGHVSVLYRKA